jgi:glycosyltransferase involved in cell wall biosynthesis
MSTISIIIPAYNREAYVGAAIDSVLAQTRPPDEIVVVDDGSTDRSAEIARAYGGTVRCVSQENQGIAGARNTGLKEVSGDLIALLDSDDLMTGRRLELQVAWLEAHPETDMVFSHMKPFLSPEIDPALRSFDSREMPATNAGSLMTRREVFAKVGFFGVARDEPDFFPWFTRACDLGLTHYILPELLLLRRVHLSNTVDTPDFRLRYVRFLKQRLDQKRRGAAPTG